MGTDDQGTDGHGYSIERIHLIVKADLPGFTDAKFGELAEQPRALCAISKILWVPISLEASRT
jgi:osmotically inducible protein OsmC